MNRRTVQLSSERIPPAAILERVSIRGPHQVPALRNQGKQKMGVEKGIEDSSRIWPTKSNNKDLHSLTETKTQEQSLHGPSPGPLAIYVLWPFTW